METACLPDILFGDVLDGVAVDMVNDQHDKLLQAMRTFHLLFGHTNVPKEFVVPYASASWPQGTWGLHLGQLIAKSNDMGQVCHNQVALTSENTNVAEQSWKHQILPLLRIFYHENGHCHIQSNFMVPKWAPWPQDAWGLNLGAIVKQIRDGRCYADQATRDRDALEKMGFLWDPIDVKWQECILPALVTFADECGDKEAMTCDFVVPSKMPWPKQTWGFQLGRFLTDSQWREQYFVQIAQDMHVLDSLGFEVQFSDSTWERQVVPLLTLFSTVFPNQLKLHEDFVIPQKLPWPRKMWGLRLGNICARNANRMVEVEKEWRQRCESCEQSPHISEEKNEQWRNKILPALVTYVEVFGSCRIKGQFTVPSQYPWPEQTWGLRLGAVIVNFMQNGTLFEQIGRDADRLDTLGFSFKLYEGPWEHHGAPLLNMFSSVYPCRTVPDNFVVPAEAPWQEATWGIKFGRIVSWNSVHVTEIENEWRTQVLTAVKVYRKARGKKPIGEKFVIPSQYPWPPQTWGMDLAHILHRLHIGECYDGHVALAKASNARLQNLLHRRQDEDWVLIFAALRMMSKTYGHCNVKPHFVVPGQPPWPKTVWNLQLGQIIANMEMTGNFFSYVGRFADRLSKLGFKLTLSPAVWEKKAAPLIATFAKLQTRDKGSSQIGLGFTIPPTEPWPKNVWGVKLGTLIEWNRSLLETIERDWRAQVLLAIEVYHYETDNDVVHDNFVVPSRSPWPYKTWGRTLQHLFPCIQKGQHYDGHIALADYPLDKACVVSSSANEKWKTVVLPALHAFATVFGHCSVSADFVVPSQCPWPKEMFGLQLGSIVSDMETHGLYFAEVGLNADRLEALGFSHKLADTAWQMYVAPLLKMFATQFPHEVLPEDFVVPPKNIWPQKLWGLRLGKIVSWACRFAWNHKQTQWKEREMPENTRLAGEYGYCKVPASFKVPCELPWPKPMWGLQMKQYLHQMNQSADLFLPSGLHCMMKEQVFGFVFKLETEGMKYEEPEHDGNSAIVSPQPEETESCLGKRPCTETKYPRQEDWIGEYSPKARKARVERFWKKRQERVWENDVKYDVRKDLADARLRVQGRFVTRQDEETMQELLCFT